MIIGSDQPASAFGERGVGGEDRDPAADARDQAADERERAADERDRIADLRELLTTERIRVAEEDLAGMRTAMDTRALIEQAKGMIMMTLKIDADAAFDVLVRRSQTSHMKVSDVAAEIVLAGSRGTV